jgi:rod shape-determining protein MreB
MFSKDIGIDLGTTNVLIYIKGKGVVLDEPSILTVDTETKKVLAVGKEAKEMLGRTPDNIKVVRPMKDGVIADFELTEIMLNTFIKKVKGKDLFRRPKILICCPTNITQVEKNAIKEAAERTGARRVYIEEEPKVAAVGAGMDISKPSANLIVDIGGGTTDIAVLSLNSIVSSTSIRVAGNRLDDDIIKYIKHKYKILLGEKSAEKIKIEFANIYKPSKKQKIEVKGRNIDTGLPDSVEITEEDTYEALKESIERIVKAIKEVLEDTPPELSADIVDRGLIITGGGSSLKGFQDLLANELKIPILTAKDPLRCVVEGAGLLLNETELLEKDNEID